MLICDAPHWKRASGWYFGIWGFSRLTRVLYSFSSHFGRGDRRDTFLDFSTVLKDSGEARKPPE
jgi:hypothetical protein